MTARDNHEAPAAAANKKAASSPLDRLLMEIAYMGALSGLVHLAEDVFSFCAENETASEAAKMGQALARLCRRDEAGAARILEDLLGSHGETAEAKALLIMAYRRQKARGDRVAELTASLSDLPEADPSRGLAARIEKR